MIKYALVCSAGHDFEGWFGASADYDDQAARGLLECPVCGASEVKKQIMAPAVAGTKAQKGGELNPQMREMMMQAQAAVRSHVEDNIRHASCDLSCTTLNKGSPHALICTKNQASYEKRVKQRRQDLEAQEKLA